MKKLKLVEDWRNARKWLSMKCLALLGVVQTSWLLIPAEMKATVPPDLVGKVTIGLVGLAIVGRVLQQEPAAAPAPEDPQ